MIRLITQRNKKLVRQERASFLFQGFIMLRLAYPFCLAQPGSATRAGEQGIRRNFVPTGRAVKPVSAGAALLLREALFLLALGATAIHLALT